MTEESAGTGRHRVLVVDDNAVNARLLEATLRAEGNTVAVAHSADEVRRAVGEHDPEIVLMDIQLPGTDGLTLTRELRADPQTSGLVIIAVTAFAHESDRRKAIDSGCDGFMPKPIDTRTLGAELETALRARGSDGSQTTPAGTPS